MAMPLKFILSVPAPSAATSAVANEIVSLPPYDSQKIQKSFVCSSGIACVMFVNSVTRSRPTCSSVVTSAESSSTYEKPAPTGESTKITFAAFTHDVLRCV